MPTEKKTISTEPKQTTNQQIKELKQAMREQIIAGENPGHTYREIVRLKNSKSLYKKNDDLPIVRN